MMWTGSGSRVAGSRWIGGDENPSKETPARGASKGVTAERLRHAVRLCLAREPSSNELAVLGQLFADLHAAAKADPNAAAKLVGATKPAGADTVEAAAWVALARAIMNLDEFVTRE